MPWDEIMDGKDVNESWVAIKTVIETMINKYVPWREKKRNQRPKWYNRGGRSVSGQKKGVESMEEDEDCDGQGGIHIIAKEDEDADSKEKDGAGEANCSKCQIKPQIVVLIYKQ